MILLFVQQLKFSLIDLFPQTDFQKMAYDLFPTTNIVGECENTLKRLSDINPTGSVQLEPEDLLVRVSINKHHTNLPFYSNKRTTDGKVAYPQDRVGYPLISSAFVKDNGHIRAAFSGLCAFPFRSFELENVLCDRGAPLEERLDQIMGLLPGQIVNDMEGSGDYREFLFRNTVKEALGQLEAFL